MRRDAWKAWSALLLAAALTAAGCGGGESGFTSATAGIQPEADEVASATQALSPKPPKYEVIGLGRLPGASQSDAVAINNGSEVVGTFPGIRDRGFLWREGEGLKELGFVPTDINDWGVVVGNAQSSSGNFEQQPVGWFAAQTYPLPTGSVGQGRAEGINNWLQIVGTLSTPTGNAVGWWWTGLPLDLGVPISQGLGLNDFGVAVGASVQGAWRWSGGVLEYLPQFFPSPGQPGVDWKAKKINNGGVVIGDSDVLNYGALIYSNGVVTGLPLIGSNAAPPSSVYGLNASGDAVGWEFVTDVGRVAVLWPAGGAPIALNSLLSKKARAEWNLIIARDINDSGEIVGYGEHEGTHYEAFLLRPKKKK